MADTKVSALPASGALVAGDLLYTVAGGISSKSTVTQVQTAVTAGFTPANRLINTTSPLAGGGDLSADRTLTIADAAADGVTKGAAAFLAADFNSAAGVISIDYTNGQSASAVNKGFLTAADFTTFSSGSLPVVDTTAVVKGSGDPTKLLRFEVDGFTAGATRILTPPNANATIAGLQIAQTFTEVQTFTPGDNLIPIVIAAGSVTGAGTSPFLNMSGTWNTTGAPDAIRLTVTDTASNAAANLLDLMVGAASLFAVRKDGRATVAGDALIAGAASPAITSIRVSVGAAAAQNVIRINGNSTADNAPVLDFLRSGNREWTMAPIGNSFFIGNSGGVANFNDATLNATPNWEFTSTGALKLNLGTVATGLLHVNTNTSGAGLTIFEQASADADDYDLSFRKARGTVAVPTVITVADQLGSILFRGYSGAGGYVTGASIRALSAGTIATTRVSASLIFATGTDAAPTVLTDRWVINNSGSFTTALDNVYDIGASAALRPRAGYFGTSVVASPVAIDADVTNTVGTASALYLATIASANNTQAFIGYGNASNGPSIVSMKTRATGSTNANTIVASGDGLFNVVGYGADGADYRPAARISMVVDGTPGASDMPGRIEFATTPDGAATPVVRLTIGNDGVHTYGDSNNLAFNTGTGTKIGTATTQKLAFWNKAPIVQPTNAIAAAAFVANTSGTLNDTATFGGYTIGQLAAALIAVGILT